MAHINETINKIKYKFEKDIKGVYRLDVDTKSGE